MKTIFTIIEITRPLNAIITFAVVIVSAIISSDSYGMTNTIFFAGLSASLVTAAANIINDYFDFEIDKINKPNRPLPSGRLNKNSAISIYVILTVISLPLSFQISTNALLIVIITTLLLFFYSKIFKSIPLVGNTVVAVCAALAFVFGGLAVENWQAAIVPTVFAFFITLIRELLKDIEDLDGDLRNGIITFPGKFGQNKTKKLILMFSILLISSTFYPFITEIYKIEYFVIVLLLVDLILIKFLLIIFSKNFTNNISQLSLLLKVVMIFGLFAIFMG